MNLAFRAVFQFLKLPFTFLMVLQLPFAAVSWASKPGMVPVCPLIIASRALSADLFALALAELATLTIFAVCSGGVYSFK
ncbi:MAG: hypothetical protein A3J25_00815 [Pseudomonadales bacterium RIFCSPLOWO2_02_FULL_63_210]|nr:MAG: hypothetical protein A3J25_00815 [Pseudomonadales bacterium RIFCSPLOWO2_02_FULL_63_210]